MRRERDEIESIRTPAGNAAGSRMSDNVSTCAPGYHRELVANGEKWLARTKYLGIQEMNGDGPDLELRNCVRCFSTLAREIKRLDSGRLD